MASQPVEPNIFYVEILSSFIHLDIWQPSEGEVLLLQREPTNVKAVSVMKNALVVEHVPYNFAALFSKFLSRT